MPRLDCIVRTRAAPRRDSQRARGNRDVFTSAGIETPVHWFTCHTLLPMERRARGLQPVPPA